ncbi:MAG: MOSC domain-containing protein [Acidimicrobiales bacterium]
MRVRELWRYPVKSLQGEQLTETTVGPLGFEGDRRWGIVDTETGYVLTARREPQLLFGSARLVGPDEVAITLPDGTVTTDDAALSAWLGRPVHLRRADDTSVGTYETPTDDEAAADDHAPAWDHWQGPVGVFHDSSRTQVSLCSTASIGEWDRRRFRFNVIVDSDDAWAEEDLVGSAVRLGTAELVVRKQIDRCVMTTRPQPGGIGRDTSVLKRINRERSGCLGIGALVSTVGSVALGDELVASGPQ